MNHLNGNHQNLIQLISWLKFKKMIMVHLKESYIYSNGVNLTKSSQFQKYYTLILHVGFDEKKHGYINPCNDVLNDYIVKKQDYESYKSTYKPAVFILLILQMKMLDYVILLEM